MIIPAAIGALGSVVGGLIGKRGAEKTNQKQIDMTYDLTKNKHKYAMEDMKRSGLNPLLSVTTPSSAGSAPKLDNPSKQLGESVSAASNSAASLAIQKQQLDNLEAQNHLTKAQAGKVHQETIGINQQNERRGVWTPAYEAGGDIIETVFQGGKDLLNSHSTKSIPPLPVPKFAGKVGEMFKSKDEIMRYFKQHPQLADERPRLTDSDYKRKIKVYNYLQSLKKGKN